MTKTDKVVVILLRLLGITALFALVAVFMPVSWTAATHRWLRLGRMPSGPVVEYLARSVSAFYAFFGALCLVVASDLERYRPLVRFLGVRFALMGLVLLGVDVAAAMLSWSAFEGPPEIGVGAVLFFLTRPEGATPMKEIRTEIEIDAPAERAWRILTDFASFPQWNPFIRQATGEPKVGARLEVRIHPPGSKGMTFRPTVLRAEPNRELRWLGRLWIPWLFDGEHAFLLEPLGPARTRLVQRETFRGLLVPFLAKWLERSTCRGFEDMNRALKARVEQGCCGEERRMTSRQHITIDWPNHYGQPSAPHLAIATVDQLADWLEAKYQLMYAWTSYNPSQHHGAPLVFRHVNDEYYYDPNDRRVNLMDRNQQGQDWLSTAEFFEYLLHELVHDFTRFDEQYCREMGIENLTYQQYNSDPSRKNAIDRVVEALCEYFKNRLWRS